MHIGVVKSMSELLMASVVKTETAEESPSLYDLEYRSGEDDAWYSVFVVFDAGAKTLTVRYSCSPVHEAVFSAADFRTAADVEELIGRFRPISQQLQDRDCLKLSTGTTVCAAHGISYNDDLRFYDAIVEEVVPRRHCFYDGEEECLCTFVLFWQHGRGRGTLTSVNIASICLLESANQLDPRISAFAKMVKKKIASFDTPSNGPSPMESDTSKELKNLTVKTKGLGPNQDEDMGPTSCITDHFFILINNLEKDLTPSAITNFIHEKTAILPEACVFPSLFTDPFAKGAIMVDSQKKAQIIQEYLENPNHLVVSLRGRPWVITTKASAGLFAASIWNFIPASRLQLDEIKHERTHRELEVVVSGTESYEKAKQFRDLVVQFLHHESYLHKKLVLEEKRFLSSYKPSIIS